MIYGLVAALGWGFADFFAAMAGRRMGSIATVVLGQTISAVFMTAVLLATGTEVAPLTTIAWVVVLNGFFTAVAYGAHYRALELGPVAVVSPISAGYVVVGVALAIIVLGERPDPIAFLGAAVVVAGAFLVSTDLHAWREGIRERPPGLPWAIVSTIGFGVAGFMLAYGSKHVGWVLALWASRVAQIVFYTPLFAARRHEVVRLRTATKVTVAFAVGAGVADILGVTTYAAGAEAGYVSIVLAASAVFPLIAVALSIGMLHERLVTNQWVGVAAVVLGLALLGLGSVSG